MWGLLVPNSLCTIIEHWWSILVRSLAKSVSAGGVACIKKVAITV